jgi:CHAD domain-containing protein
MTRPTGTLEVELKYRLRKPGAGDSWLAAEELAGLRSASRIRTTQLEDRYLDTADGALARAGFAARLRVSPSSTIVSVKSTARRGAQGGPHRREELEGPADRTSGPRDWPSSDARSLILELCGDAPLVELVTIRQLRRRRELRDDATAVELSLDEVDVVARSQVVDRFSELELELLRGDEARLEALAELLDADPALDASRGSKLEAALAAVRAHVRRHGPLPEIANAEGANGVDEPRANQGAAAPVASVVVERPPAPPAKRRAAPSSPAQSAPPLSVGKSPGVTADDHIAEAGRKVLRFHLARLLAREAGTREGSDPEELHAMRVATRRMRAAWRVFGSGYRTGRTRRYRKRLREIAARLGAVRDLDVLIEAAGAWRADQPAADQPGLDPLLAAWTGYRDDARRLLAHELDSAGYRRFIEDFRVFVHADGAGVRPTAPAEPHHVQDTAPSAVWAAYERLRAYEPVIRWADIETLHDLRIAAKWLRYTLEFVREPLGPDAGGLIARIVDLQDHLGLLHDADVAAAMARQFLVEHGGELQPSEREVIGRYLASRESELARLRGSVGPAWRGVTGLGFRRRLARALAGL